MVQSAGRSFRTWQDIAREASRETDPNRLLDLCDELERAFDTSQRPALGAMVAAPVPCSSSAGDLGWRNSYRELGRESRITDLLASAIAVTEADFGDVQLLDSSEPALKIVAHQGFGSEFLNYFAVVGADSSCSCGASMKRQSRLIVGDVESDPGFDDAAKAMLLRADVQAVQSTPLIDNAGNFIGVVSTHYRRAGSLFSPDMQAKLDALVSDFLEQ